MTALARQTVTLADLASQTGEVTRSDHYSFGADCRDLDLGPASDVVLLTLIPAASPCCRMTTAAQKRPGSKDRPLPDNDRPSLLLLAGVVDRFGIHRPILGLAREVLRNPGELGPWALARANKRSTERVGRPWSCAERTSRPTARPPTHGLPARGLTKGTCTL